MRTIRTESVLKRVDKYAKAHSMKRAEMIAEGLKLILDRKTR